MNTDAATTSQERVPTSWPGAFGLYKYSKPVVEANIWTLVFVGLLSLVASGVAGALFKQNIGDLVSFIVGSLVAAANALIFLTSIRGHKIKTGDAIKKSVPFWLNMILLNLLVLAATISSILLFVIPFFFVFPRLVLANYYLVDKRMAPLEAFKASWNATKGQSSKVWGIIGANLAYCLLFVTIIGAPFAIYFLIMYSGAMALLYSYLQKQPDSTVASINK